IDVVPRRGGHRTVEAAFIRTAVGEVVPEDNVAFTIEIDYDPDIKERILRISSWLSTSINGRNVGNDELREAPDEVKQAVAEALYNATGYRVYFRDEDFGIDVAWPQTWPPENPRPNQTQRR
ncbi:MAG: hypothetical protein AAF449_17645, partial [Myxococcota bacterium]